jgi:hypothetical protein
MKRLRRRWDAEEEEPEPNRSPPALRPLEYEHDGMEEESDFLTATQGWDPCRSTP